MKTKNYRNGTLTCKGYLKTVGNGYEVGFTFGPKTIFLGNFIKATEANKWWALMNQEIRSFNKRFKVSPRFPRARYSHFLSAHLYNKYYTFVNRLIPKHHRSWAKLLKQDTRTFKKLSSKATPRERRPFLKAA